MVLSFEIEFLSFLVEQNLAELPTDSSADLFEDKAWLDEWVYGVKDREAYWQKLGAETHKRLEVPEQMSEPINYGKY